MVKSSLDVSKIKAVVSYLSGNLPKKPTVAEHLYTFPSKIADRYANSNRRELIVQELADHIGFYLGIIDSAKVQFVEDSKGSFDFQVDHFFRFSKFASNGVFSIGDRLFQEANPHFIKQNSEPNKVSFKTGRPGACSQFTILTFNQQREGKGVSIPYSIHYLMERHKINEIRHQNNQLKNPNIRNTYLLLRRLGALRDIKRKKD